jgi:hypothetical protein
MPYRTYAQAIMRERAEGAVSSKPSTVRAPPRIGCSRLMQLAAAACQYSALCRSSPHTIATLEKEKGGSCKKEVNPVERESPLAVYLSLEQNNEGAINPLPAGFEPTGLRYRSRQRRGCLGLTKPRHHSPRD